MDFSKFEKLFLTLNLFIKNYLNILFIYIFLFYFGVDEIMLFTFIYIINDYLFTILSFSDFFSFAAEEEKKNYLFLFLLVAFLLIVV